VQPVVELVGGEETAFVEPFPYGGKAGGSHGIAGTITAKHQQAARTGKLKHERKKKGRKWDADDAARMTWLCQLI
jgi:hypothetical protein